MTVTRRRALAIAAGTSALLVPGVAEAKPPPGKGKPPRIRTVAASDELLGVDVRTIRLTVGTPGGSTQTAVALTAADGETVTAGIQSNFAGNGFYTRNGYTRSTAWAGQKPSGGNYAGWDDTSFLPITTWLTDFSGTGFFSRMDDLGLNGMMPAAGSITLSDCVTFGKWAVSSGQDPSGADSCCVGIDAGEEPSTEAQYEGIIADATAWLTGPDGSGRWHLFNFADNLINGDLAVIYTPEDMVLGRDDTHPSPQPQFTSCDQYWFAGAPNNAGGSQTKLHYRLYGFGGDATTAQCARGSHYGSMLDSIRKRYSGTPTGPFAVWIENGAPYIEAASAAITPAQLKWAVWATLVHGARSIHYFNHTFRDPDPLQSANNLNSNGYGGPGITGTGIYAATKELNLNALSIAPAINGPIDGYFVWGDVAQISTTGFLTAVTSTNARAAYAGVDACCKWNPLEAKHYILATTREPEASTNIPVTFRMVDQGQTSAVRLFDTTGTIAVTRGGSIPVGFCEFVDTFATAATYKAYRIE